MGTWIAKADVVVVEHRPPDGTTTKLWCVLQNGRVLFMDDHIDPALWAARAIASDDQCAAWLVVPERKPIKIPPKGSQLTRS